MTGSVPRRIAIVHEWFTSMRGGEKCVEALCEIFPHATLFTLLHTRGSVSPLIERMPIHTSFIQSLPGARTHYRHYLPLFPSAITRFNLEEFDLVISSHHCVAKGVRTGQHTLHLCYCHTPMRYIWGAYDEYFAKGRAGLGTRLGMRLTVGALRSWDVKTAARPHAFIANSENVRRRIRSLYGRDAEVIHPPVDVSSFQLSKRDEGYFLIVTALVPYKRIDLAVEAFNASGERLLIAGDGPEADRLRRLGGRNVEFLGWLDDSDLRSLYAGCTALIFPGEEDFGIVPLEAMACGKPVIAFGKGGALETVIDTDERKTGILFPDQTPASLNAAIARFRTMEFDPAFLRHNAESFDRKIFQQRIREYIEEKWSSFEQGVASTTRDKRG